MVTGNYPLDNSPLDNIPEDNYPVGQLPHRTITPQPIIHQDNYPPPLYSGTITPEGNYPIARKIIPKDNYPHRKVIRHNFNYTAFTDWE